MKNKIIITLSLVVSTGLLGQLPSLAKGDPASGKKVFSQNCATCHGASGKGDGVAAAALNPKPNNFTKGKFKYGSKDTDLAKTIKTGKGPMPPWGSVLSDKNVSDVISYIRTLKK